jgi:hypothetical protein
MRGWLLLLATAALAAQDYRALPTGAPPAQLAAEMREALQSRGVKIVDPNRFTFCEVWLREAPVSEGTSAEEALKAGGFPEGALAGAIRFASPGADRYGRGFGPGLYTLRALPGDSLLMIKAEDDQRLSPPETERLEALSRKVSRTDAPALLRLVSGAAGPSPRLRMSRDGEWTLHLTLGQTPVALLVVGVAR